MAVSSDGLFERVLTYCGLAPMIGPGIVQRALADEGANAATATPADYRRALPRLEARLRAYYKDTEIARRSRRIIGFLAFAEGELDFDDELSFSTVGRTYQELKAEEERRAATRTSGTVVREDVRREVAEAVTRDVKRR